MEHDNSGHIGTNILTRLKSIDTKLLSQNSGAQLDAAGASGEELRITLFGDRITVTCPQFGMAFEEKREIKESMRSLILYYLVTADGAEPYGRWVALSELPGGEFYNRAYQGYSGNRLISRFGNDLDLFEKAAISVGGSPEDYGDIGFSFSALPRVPLLAVYWKGDEEFTPSAKVLFDGSASHYLPTDLCAYLGSILTERLIESAGR